MASQSGPAITSSRPEPVTRLFRSCGAAGARSLGCTTLRLPAGYRVSGGYEPPLTRCLRSVEPGTCGARA